MRGYIFFVLKEEYIIKTLILFSSLTEKYQKIKISSDSESSWYKLRTAEIKRTYFLFHVMGGYVKFIIPLKYYGFNQKFSLHFKI